MSKINGNPSEQGYWEERIKLYKDNLADMIFLDPRREDYWGRVKQELQSWPVLEVLDVCCGYGQFSDMFHSKDYTGIDFSQGMIELANKLHPDYCFKQMDIKEISAFDKFDIIFEVNSLRSLGWTSDQFFEKFKPYAKKIIACLECDEFKIFNIYDRTRKT